MKPEYTITQGFGLNYNNSYQTSGLKGHPGVDYSKCYGAPIHSLFDQEYVYKVLTVDHPANDGSGFTGVFTIIDNGIETFEFLYGHGDPQVKVGDILHKGDLVMTEGNHGQVFSGGIQITLTMQKAGDKRGTHVHGQKRPLYKHTFMRGGYSYLTGPDGNAYCKDGVYYAYAFPNNGYAGCVDWTAPFFSRNLMLGMSGYDVQCLQNFLKARGFLKIDQTTDYFGKATLGAVSAFQKANGISPILGFVGEKTRQLINSILQ
jgi:hypothetical protein